MFRLSTPARNSLFVILALLAYFSLRNRNHSVDELPVSYISSRETVEIPKNDPPAPRDARLIGDHSLRDELHLDQRTQVNGHYEVTLPDGAVAVLTLDPVVQEAAEKVLVRAKAPMGAVVVMKTDGTILALAGRNNAKGKHDDVSLATSVWAPAASVFKVVTATALIESGVHPKLKVCYHGGLRSIDKSNLVDNARIDSACNTLGYGLAKSQNALIAKLSNKYLDPIRLGEMAAKFGFGNSPKWSLKTEAARINLPKDPLEFSRVAAGFWNTEISPLSGALIANTIASHGFQVTPQLVAEVREADRVIPVEGIAPIRVLESKPHKP